MLYFLRVVVQTGFFEGFELLHLVGDIMSNLRQSHIPIKGMDRPAEL